MNERAHATALRPPSEPGADRSDDHGAGGGDKGSQEPEGQGNRHSPEQRYQKVPAAVIGCCQPVDLPMEQELSIQVGILLEKENPVVKMTDV